MIYHNKKGRKKIKTVFYILYLVAGNCACFITRVFCILKGQKRND